MLQNEATVKWSVQTNVCLFVYASSEEILCTIVALKVDINNNINIRFWLFVLTSVIR